MGRRDLLTLGILLIVLPLVSLAGIRVLKPRFKVYREFNPASVETSSTTTVRLAVARTGIATGQVVMEEHLPPRFGDSPAFRFPARSAVGGTSRYEYHLRSGKRGQFVIGPVTAEFTDPFGLSLHRHAIDDGDTLTVTPAAVELPATGLAGARGNDGVTATRIRANPSDDDVMTREYRHGDPMRRVHWAATARHGALMVRQEESVTTPEATIILDQRWAAFAARTRGRLFRHLRRGRPRPGDQRTFEWAVTAAMSVSAHLAERNYALRFLDPAGEPAFLHSPSAPEPEAEEYTGSGGLQSIAESLAAIQLHPAPTMVRRRESGPATPSTTGSWTSSPPTGSGAPSWPSSDICRPPRHAPCPPAAGFGANAFAIVVTDQPRRLPGRPRDAEVRRLAGRGRCPRHVGAGGLVLFRPARCGSRHGRRGRPPRHGGQPMTLTPQRHSGSGRGPHAPKSWHRHRPRRAQPRRVGAQPWVMAAAVAVSVAGAALGLNGVLRGWAWYLPVLTTVCVVALAMAVLRSLRAQPFLVALGGFASLVFILTFTFFRRDSIAGFIPSGDTMAQLGRYLRRASETVLAESSPVAPNAGIVLVTCAVLGLVVILVDALAVPLALPATSGLGLLAILVVPAMVKPQSVGAVGFRRCRRRVPDDPGVQPVVRPGQPDHGGHCPQSRTVPPGRPDRRHGAGHHAPAPARRSRLRPGHLPAGFPAESVGFLHRAEPDDQPGQQPAESLRRRAHHLRHQRQPPAVPALGHRGPVRRRFLVTGRP